MPLKINMLTLGLVQTNCFMLGDEATKTAVLIDAPDNAPIILDNLEREGWQLVGILATHAHWDHVRAVRGVKEATGAPFYLHADDLPLLENMPTRIKQLTGQDELPAPPPDVFVTAGSTLTFPAFSLEVRFTPGHTRGHVSYILHEGAVAFSGDCLFEGSIGRTDLPGADFGTLMESIVDQLLSLPDDYTVACGHGRTTTIAQERHTNPFIADWLAQRGGER